MRRVLGAMIVVLLLGARHVPHVLEREPRVPATPVAPAVPTAPEARFLPAPAVSGSAAFPATPRPRPARAEIPATFREAPLAFLSRAPADSLDLLPGIGPVLASRIHDARRERGSFTSWDDVLAVRGVGPKTIERLQALAERRPDR